MRRFVPLQLVLQVLLLIPVSCASEEPSPTLYDDTVWEQASPPEDYWYVLPLPAHPIPHGPLDRP